MLGTMVQGRERDLKPVNTRLVGCVQWAGVTPVVELVSDGGHFRDRLQEA